MKDNVKSYMDELVDLNDRKRFKIVADIKKVMLDKICHYFFISPKLLYEIVRD